MIRVVSVQIAAGILVGCGCALNACAAAPRLSEQELSSSKAPRAPAPGRVALSEIPEPGGPVLTRRRDGVRLLREDADPWFASLPAGRYEVPLGPDHVYEVTVPRRSEVFAGTFFHPRLGVGSRTGRVFIDGPVHSVRLPTDPCHDHTYRPVRRSPALLARALARQPDLVVSTPRATTVGGHRAVALRVEVPRRPRLDRCPGRRVGLYSTTRAGHPWTAAGGYVGRFWIVAVDRQRYVVRAEHPDGTPPAELDVLDRMVESIRFHARRSQGPR